MSKLQMDFTLLKERMAQLEDGWTNGGFEWLDGMLVQALQAGDWLLMDNVNFCKWGKKSSVPLCAVDQLDCFLKKYEKSLSCVDVNLWDNIILKFALTNPAADWS